MAALTTTPTEKMVFGQLAVARVSIGSATTADIVAAVTGKKVFVIGLEVTQATAQGLSLLSAADVLQKWLAVQAINLPITPGHKPGSFVCYHQSTVSEALRLTTGAAAEATVWYIQD